MIKIVHYKHMCVKRFIADRVWASPQILDSAVVRRRILMAKGLWAFIGHYWDPDAKIRA